MGFARPDPRRVKIHRTYGIDDVAKLCEVSPSSVRLWQRQGLRAVDGCRPAIFSGAVLRAFLAQRRLARRAPTPDGRIYCFKCRAHRAPAGAMADYTPRTARSGNLSALCSVCETVMNRAIRACDIPRKMPGIEVRAMNAQPHLRETP